MNLKSFFYPPINQKRKAAIWILQEITKDLKHKYPISGIWDANGEKKDVDPAPSYKIYKFKELQPLSSFSKETFYYALCMLYEREHIKPYFGTGFDYNVIEFQCKLEGHTALHDCIYQNEISTYNNDRFYAGARWTLPIVAITISIISLCISTCRKPAPIVLPLLRIDTMQQKTKGELEKYLPPTGVSQPKLEKGNPDTTKNNASNAPK